MLSDRFVHKTFCFYFFFNELYDPEDTQHSSEVDTLNQNISKKKPPIFFQSVSHRSKEATR